MTDEKAADRQAQIRAIGVASGLGCSVVVSLVLLVGGGVLLDQWRGTAPIFTLVGVAVGLAVATYELTALVRVANRLSGQGSGGSVQSRSTGGSSRPEDWSDTDQR